MQERPETPTMRSRRAAVYDGLDTHALAERERSKYERMYERPEYRQVSPGMTAAPAALMAFEVVLGAAPGDTVLDWGCGLGRATAWLREKGYDARGMDLVDVREDPGVPFVLGNVWNPPPELEASDWAYSVDVMEHVPETLVGTVLRVMRRYTRRGAYFQIATIRDQCGLLIGERLHLTIRPLAWWRARLQEAAWSIREEKIRETHVEFLCVTAEEEGDS